MVIKWVFFIAQLQYHLFGKNPYFSTYKKEMEVKYRNMVGTKFLFCFILIF